MTIAKESGVFKTVTGDSQNRGQIIQIRSGNSITARNRLNHPRLIQIPVQGDQNIPNRCTMPNQNNGDLLMAGTKLAK